MRYLDVSTRKRPEWSEFWTHMCDTNNFLCMCGGRIFGKEDVFKHWNEGHFDEYDEVKEK